MVPPIKMFNSGFPPNPPRDVGDSSLAKALLSGTSHVDVRVCWSQQVQCTQCNKMSNNEFPPNPPRGSSLAKALLSGPSKTDVRIERFWRWRGRNRQVARTCQLPIPVKWSQKTNKHRKRGAGRMTKATPDVKCF